MKVERDRRARFACPPKEEAYPEITLHLNSAETSCRSLMQRLHTKRANQTANPQFPPQSGSKAGPYGAEKNSTFCNVLSVCYLIVFGVVEVRRVELLTS